MIENKYSIRIEYINRNGLKCIGTRNYDLAISKLKEQGMEIIPSSVGAVRAVFTANNLSFYDVISSAIDISGIILCNIASTKMQDRFASKKIVAGVFFMDKDEYYKEDGEYFAVRIEKEDPKEPTYSLTVKYINETNIGLFTGSKIVLPDNVKKAFKDLGFFEVSDGDMILEKHTLKYTEAAELVDSIYNKLYDYFARSYNDHNVKTISEFINPDGRITIKSSKSDPVLIFSILKEEEK